MKPVNELSERREHDKLIQKEYKIAQEEKLEDFKNAIHNFIDDNYMVRTGDINAEIIPDTTDGGNHYDKSIKELFDEVRKM